MRYCNQNIDQNKNKIQNLQNQFSMRNISNINCEICRRLGKRQCGFHQYKRQVLSSYKKSKEDELKQVQSRTTVFRKQNIKLTEPQYRPVTHQNILHTSINYSQPTTIKHPQIRFSQPQIPLQPLSEKRFSSVQQFPRQKIIYKPNKPHINQAIYYPKPQQATFITRIQNQQLFYYPIYPVYEIVYEPIDSSISGTPSRLSYYE